ncbi:MAG: YraN family protein [Nitrospirae bacterium]|nr:YraN family protein [Nitrospirota bacterium]
MAFFRRLRVLSKKDVGDEGETLAVRFLKQNGYRILVRNYRCALGEIDIVALHDKTISFVEVKSRRSARFGPAAAAVTPRKQGQIIKAAQAYLASGKWDGFDFRFDVVAIDWQNDRPMIQHIAGAFETP